ncbi:MAG: hypothetical protein K2M87_05390 [Muribaculaceae bacterium]|nr:hypothetical protein [Muribaculaceae bacterium]
MTAQKRSLPVRVAKWFIISLASIIALLVLALLAVTLWLTPSRLANLVNREASKAMHADLKVSDINYTLWSTFPHFRIQIDSVELRSRTLDSLPESQRKNLPENADFLLSSGPLSGGVNLAGLLRGRIMLGDLKVDNLKVNLVALNDSVNNFDIVTSDDSSGHIPYFHVDNLRVLRGEISFTGIPSDTYAKVDLADARLKPGKHLKKKDTYSLALNGNVSAQSDGLVIFRKFPFGLDGDVNIGFKPFSVSTDNYRVALGRVRGRVSLSLEAGENPALHSFRYDMEGSTLDDLLSVIPGSDKLMLSGLKADVDVDASAALTSPYKFSSAYLPSVRIDFGVPAGTLEYTLNSGRTITADHLGLQGSFLFDGAHPSKSLVEIPNLEIAGEGSNLQLEARATDLANDPLVTTRIKANGDLAALAKHIPAIIKYNPQGDYDLNTEFSFRIDGETVHAVAFTADVKSARLKAKVNGSTIQARDFEVSTHEDYADAVTTSALANNIPYTLSLKAANLSYFAPADTLDMKVGNLTVQADVKPGRNKSAKRTGTMLVKAGNAAISKGKMKSALRGLDLSLKGFERSVARRFGNYATPAAWGADASRLNGIEHSPELITVSLPEIARNLLADFDANLTARLDKATIKVPGYAATSSIRNFYMTANTDSVSIRRLRFDSGSTGGNIALTAANLRQFLTSRTPAPLRLNVMADIDTLQLNQLARLWADANPQSAVARGDEAAMGEGNNTRTMMLPRNVEANIRAKSKRTRYINLAFSDLLANVHLANGILDVDTLQLATTFGAAGASFRYDTSDIERLGLSANVDIDSISITGALAKFPALLRDMPSLANLSGTLAASLRGGGLIYPNMYINIPSLSANANLDALHIRLEQDDFIRRITRMLMLPDRTLDFANINIRAGVHNNLLEVYPFNFQVDKYRLILEGVNNFNGDLYYHIGVEKWPLMMPFGINIKGSYHHPQVRFGSKDWHDRNGAEVTIGVEDYNKLNLMHEMRHYGGVLVHTAAAYRGQ